MSDCYQTVPVAGCYTGGAAPVSVLIHTTYDHAGQPAVRITDLASVVIAGATAANTSIGACAIAPPDVEWEPMCDVQADGSSVEFLRRSITAFNAAGTPAVTVTDWELDKVTAYVLTGTADFCPTCGQLPARGLQTAW
jgi:hypothetical protein